MMMQRTGTNIPTCRSCFWFCYERNNVGKCGNWERMVIDGIQNLPHRFATDTCGRSKEISPPSIDER